MAMTSSQKQLYEIIDEILWTEWDPLNVNPGAPRDEYSSYTPRIFSIAINKKDKELLAQKLLDIEFENMGTVSSPESAKLIADKIMKEHDRILGGG